MKKLLLIAIGVLIGTAIISSVYAEPTIIYKELPKTIMRIASENGTIEIKGQVQGSYNIKDDIITIHNNLTEEEEKETVYHEYGHYIWFKEMSRFKRVAWTRATLRNPYEPTPYSSAEVHSYIDRRHNRVNTQAYITENFAENYMLMRLGIMPPKNTRQYLILKSLKND